jgi:alkylation response protein AidB-like acyl-CoA dehydrogenase
MSSAQAMERAELREMAGEIARRELLRRAQALDAAEPAALRDCSQTLTSVGFERALLSADLGGPGLGIGELLTVLEELASGDAGMALCVLLSNAALMALPGERAASIPEGARWALVPARAGKEVTVTGRALDGRVACALGAWEADGLVVLVPGGESLTIPVEAGAPGLAVARDEAQMGLRAAPAASLAFAGVDLGSAAAGTSDGEGDAASAATGAMALLHAGTASIARGVTRRAYEMAREYAHQRQQGGVAIIQHDAVTDMLAPMTVALACPLPVPESATQALALKVAVTDTAVRGTTDAVQIFGGTGYMHETGVEKLMRDAKYCQLYPEPNWATQDELVHRQHAPAFDLLAWPAGSSAAVRASV